MLVLEMRSIVFFSFLQEKHLSKRFTTTHGADKNQQNQNQIFKTIISEILSF
jgi:hypothetical protein